MQCCRIPPSGSSTPMLLTRKRTELRVRHRAATKSSLASTRKSPVTPKVASQSPSCLAIPKGTDRGPARNCVCFGFRQTSDTKVSPRAQKFRKECSYVPQSKPRFPHSQGVRRRRSQPAPLPEFANDAEFLAPAQHTRCAEPD